MHSGVYSIYGAINHGLNSYRDDSMYNQSVMHYCENTPKSNTQQTS